MTEYNYEDCWKRLSAGPLGTWDGYFAALNSVR